MKNKELHEILKPLFDDLRKHYNNSGFFKPILVVVFLIMLLFCFIFALIPKSI